MRPLTYTSPSPSCGEQKQRAELDWNNESLWISVHTFSWYILMFVSLEWGGGGAERGFIAALQTRETGIPMQEERGAQHTVK
jgi:hypothetical protein